MIVQPRGPIWKSGSPSLQCCSNEWTPLHAESPRRRSAGTPFTAPTVCHSCSCGSLGSLGSLLMPSGRVCISADRKCCRRLSTFAVSTAILLARTRTRPKTTRKRNYQPIKVSDKLWELNQSLGVMQGEVGGPATEVLPSGAVWLGRWAAD